LEEFRRLFQLQGKKSFKSKVIAEEREIHPGRNSGKRRKRSCLGGEASFRWKDVGFSHVSLSTTTGDTNKRGWDRPKKKRTSAEATEGEEPGDGGETEMILRKET